MEGVIDAELSELALRPSSRDSRAPRIGASPNEVSLPKEEARITGPRLYHQGICTSCQQITLDRLLKTHYGSIGACWLDFNRGLPTSCPMCSMILGCIELGDEITGNIRLELRVDDPQPTIDIYTRRRIRDVRVTRYQGFDTGNVSDGWLRIYAEPDSYASKFGPNVCVPSSNLSDATFQKISSWIKECDETHTSCLNHSQQSSEAVTRYLPTRVVHVGSKTQKPRLHISQRHQSDRYIALSHCWGKIPQARTLNANIELFKKEIILGDLSKTFQDAIDVVRRLDIEYIWIDSLCIVQDDDVDWLRESERMGGIYANAYLTIAATWTADGSGGLDSIRPQNDWIRIPCDGPNKTKGYMWLTDASWTSQTDLDDAPLNTRGWVLQEKMLSRRIIHFASSQVYWQCKQRFVKEESEDLIRFEGATLEPSLFWADVDAISHTGLLPEYRVNFGFYPRWDFGFHPRVPDELQLLQRFHITWRAFVRYYCTRDLTKQSDRLIALQGITRVIEKQTGLRYCDGHWDDGSHRFMCELMWIPKVNRTLPVLDDGRRSRLCSSWSWASLEGPVEYDFDLKACKGDYGMKDCDLRLMAIEHGVRVPCSSRPLEVSGMLQPVYKCELVENHENNGRRTFVVKAKASEKAHGWVCFDREDEEPANFHFSPVHVHNGNLACLALYRKHRPESTKRCFERVGMGYFETKYPNLLGARGNSTYSDINDIFEACERETYYII